MSKIAIVTSGYFPVPASKGGAVESLDESIINLNEIYKKMNLVIFSCFDNEAIAVSKKYKFTKVIFIKFPLFVKICDNVLYFIAKNIFKKRKHLSYRYIFQRLFFINEVSKYLKRENFSKVLIENHPSLFLCLKKRKNFIKYAGRVYYHLHNIVSNDYGCKSIISNCKRVMGVSNYINCTLHDYLGPLDNNEYYVLKNKVDRDSFIGCDPTFAKNFLIRKGYDISSKKIILFTGRLSKEKGFEEVIYAFNNLNRSDCLLVIVGSYYYKSNMSDNFSENINRIISSNNRIVFTGFVDYKNVASFYKLSDVVVLPSIWDDPAPLTIIESLTLGKALITTYSGGIPEYANDKCSVLLTRDENLVSNISSSINNILNDISFKKKIENEALLHTKNRDLKNFYFDFCKGIEEDER